MVWDKLGKSGTNLQCVCLNIIFVYVCRSAGLSFVNVSPMGQRPSRAISYRTTICVFGLAWKSMPIALCGRITIRSCQIRRIGGSKNHIAHVYLQDDGVSIFDKPSKEGGQLQFIFRDTLNAMIIRWWRLLKNHFGHSFFFFFSTYFCHHNLHIRTLFGISSWI